MNHIVTIILTTLLICTSSTPIYAISDPRQVPNNKFGIHITDDSDIPLASQLVNSNGGDWGYVTLVIRQDQKDVQRWQKTFDLLRQNRLIPLVRIATQSQGQFWQKPKVEDVDGWINFLNQLTWVTKNRYLILFNEPNHAKEWGNEINPQEYVSIVKEFHKQAKANTEDYFILPAGMDDAAPDGADTMSTTRYFQQMYQADNQIFKYFDGWTSHSYPNPAFSASPQKVGPGSIAGYRSEIRFVSQFGFDDTKPVFITETGWVKSPTNSPEKIAQHYQYAFQQVWNQDNVVAITPFILKYPIPPFAEFSWVTADHEPSEYYTAVQQLPKTAGDPQIDTSYKIVSSSLPEEIINNTTYTYKINVANTGQAIWTSEETNLNIIFDQPGISAQVFPIPTTQPGEAASIQVELSVPNIAAETHGTYILTHRQRSNPTPDRLILTIRPDNDIVTKLKLWIHKLKNPNQFLIAQLVPEYLKRTYGS